MKIENDTLTFTGWSCVAFVLWNVCAIVWFFTLLGALVGIVVGWRLFP